MRNTKYLSLCSLCAVVLTLAGCVNPVPEPSDSQTSVVLISIDGFRHDYTELHAAKNIAEMAEQGVRSDGLTPVYPAKTFPNHLSIITGAYPTRHGLIDNYFYDKEREQSYRMGDGLEDSSWITAIPIWNLAEFQGLRSATFFWPESDARINGATPSYFYHYSTPTPNQQRVDQIIDWLNLPSAARPRFVTGYFSIVDTMGHRFGPTDQRTGGSVRYIDELIGQLYQRLQDDVKQPVDLILVSDHGMSAISAEAAIDYRELPIDETDFKIVNGSTRLMLYALEDTDNQTIVEQTQRLSAALTNENVEILTAEALAQRHVEKGPRVADIIIEAQAPVTFTNRDLGDRYSGGTHGFYNSREMDGLFVAIGPSFKEGLVIDSFENIHVYPLIAKLLDLEISHEIDGELKVLETTIR